MSDRGLSLRFWKLTFWKWWLLAVSGWVGNGMMMSFAQAQVVDARAEQAFSAAESSQPGEIEPPATTVEDWVAQIESSLAQIINVRVEEVGAELRVHYSKT
jgi:hypothetical protein